MKKAPRQHNKIAMGFTEYILLAFGSLFVVVDPIAVVPAFIAMTPNDPPMAPIADGATGMPVQSVGAETRDSHDGRVDAAIAVQFALTGLVERVL